MAPPKKTHVAFMVDAQTIRTERDWISRTVVGLLAASVRVTRLIPEETRDDARLALSVPVRYTPGGLPWAYSQAMQQTVADLGAHPPNIIHVIGRRSWKAAVDLAQHIDAQVAISIWTRAEVKAARRFAKHERVAAFLAGSRGLASDLALSVPRELIQTIPLAMHVPPAPRTILNQIEFSVAVLLAGREAPQAAVLSVLDGFQLIAPDFPQVMLFADLDEAMNPKVWRYVREHGLQTQFGLIPDIHEHRDLALGASILIMPAALGRCDTFLLEAMALPTAAIVAKDPYLDVLEFEDVAYVIEDGLSHSWATAIRQILADPAKANERAARARQAVARHHATVDQGSRLVQTYDRILTGGAVTIPTPTSEPA